MTTNSRKNRRVKTAISCIFGTTPDTPRSGTVTSLSVSGCFVKTKTWASNSAEMHIRLWLPAERWLPLHGTVLYHLDHIGFGLLFTDVSPDDESILNMLVERSTKGEPSAVDEESFPA